MDTTPKVKRESKNKIRVDFERAPLLERLKAKFFSVNFLKKVVYVIFRFVLLLGITYVILFPYIAKIFNSFMTLSDFKDVTVMLISKNPTIDQYKYIILENDYFSSLLNTFLLSASTALIQTVVCALIAYGLAKFKFRGNNIVFAIVVVTLMVPLEPITYALQTHFWFFENSNILGGIVAPIMNALFPPEKGVWQGFINSYVPMYVMSFTGLGFRNGLFIFMLRQFFRGVPDELEESAYVDGSSTFKTFFRIIIPISIPMLVTVFIFSFAWQWTDDYYVTTLFDSLYIYNNGFPNLRQIVEIPTYFANDAKSMPQYKSAIEGTATILIALPLIIAYVFLQDKIVQGVERSGIVG
ncbi:MAG: carbohydrate ABC transporter permease [Clostridia bacterium]|nr:carbohydrate ABC transporter permease [Clostridia bacterium]MBO5374476.1 carbohydrate ABC transporter permease [Clostridia bacterium]